MPFVNIWEPQGVRMRFSGPLTPEDALQANLAFYGDPRSDEARYQILDTLESTGLAEDRPACDYTDTIVRLAALDTGSSYSLGVVLVALVSTDRQIRALFESYAATASGIACGWETGLFEDLQSARDWIATRLSLQRVKA